MRLHTALATIDDGMYRAPKDKKRRRTVTAQDLRIEKGDLQNMLAVTGKLLTVVGMREKLKVSFVNKTDQSFSNKRQGRRRERFYRIRQRDRRQKGRSGRQRRTRHLYSDGRHIDKKAGHEGIRYPEKKRADVFLTDVARVKIIYNNRICCYFAKNPGASFLDRDFVQSKPTRT